MPNAKPVFHYTAIRDEFTVNNAFAALRALEYNLVAAEPSGCADAELDERLELWTKEGEFLFGVPVNHDETDMRSHRAQMESEGWKRRA